MNNDVPRNAKSIGRGNAYILNRLKSEDPALAARIEAGEISHYAASLSKGWRVPQAPYKQLVRWWNRATLEERLAFQDYINR